MIIKMIDLLSKRIIVKIIRSLHFDSISEAKPDYGSNDLMKTRKLQLLQNLENKNFYVYLFKTNKKL